MKKKLLVRLQIFFFFLFFWPSFEERLKFHVDFFFHICFATSWNSSSFYELTLLPCLVCYVFITHHPKIVGPTGASFIWFDSHHFNYWVRVMGIENKFFGFLDFKLWVKRHFSKYTKVMGPTIRPCHTHMTYQLSFSFISFVSLFLLYFFFSSCLSLLSFLFLFFFLSFFFTSCLPFFFSLLSFFLLITLTFLWYLSLFCLLNSPKYYHLCLAQWSEGFGLRSPICLYCGLGVPHGGRPQKWCCRLLIELKRGFSFSVHNLSPPRWLLSDLSLFVKFEQDSFTLRYVFPHLSLVALFPNFSHPFLIFFFLFL